MSPELKFDVKHFTVLFSTPARTQVQVVISILTFTLLDALPVVP